MKTIIHEEEIDTVLVDILDELDRAVKKFNAYHSGHEGYAVIKEELDELWDEIKGQHRKEEMRNEAIQVATTAIRFVLDICNSDNPESFIKKT